LGSRDAKIKKRHGPKKENEINAMSRKVVNCTVETGRENSPVSSASEFNRIHPNYECAT
jgi:hypothetical protein